MHGSGLSERILYDRAGVRESGAGAVVLGLSKAGVRPIRRRDIPEIGTLFAHTFRAGHRVDRAAIEAAIEDIYLTSPEDNRRPASLVDVDAQGRVVGFLGIVTLGARLGQRVLRGGIVGSFMAHAANRARSGPRLLRAAFASDLDFTFTDTANRTSLDLSSAMRCEVLPLHSLAWFKVLRPCAAASFFAGRAYPVLGTALGPMARLADIGARRLALAAVPPDERGGEDRPLDLAAFVARAPALTERFRLRPAWSGDELAWLCAQAARKRRNGGLEAREVLDREGRLLGLYLLYAGPGTVAHALQVLAVRNREPAVLGALLRRAEALGAVAVRGHADHSGVRGLMRCPGVFYQHMAATMLFTRDPDLRDTFQSGEAYVGGLFGESWTRLMADDFR